MLRFTTAGESHGQALMCILEGIPAGLALVASDIDAELKRRQQGYGRGRRMKIESDHAELLSGVRAGETIGSPIAMLIHNRDWKNWQEIMDPAPRDGDPERKRTVTRPRPGHADLSGMLKYDRSDARDVLERASARETTARTAAGAVCKKFLAVFGVSIGSHVIHLGGVDAKRPKTMPNDINNAADASQLRTSIRMRTQKWSGESIRRKPTATRLAGSAKLSATASPSGLAHTSRGSGSSMADWRARLCPSTP